MFNKKTLINSCKFKAVRASGSGGQHVNKVSTKVIISLNINTHNLFTEEQLIRIKTKLANKLNKDDELIVEDSSTRSQFKNKNLAISKLILLIEKALKTTKKRVPTKTPKSAKLKRLKSKRLQSERKSNRKKPDY